MDQILTTVPPPAYDPELPLQILITTLGWDDYVGRLVIGRIQNGTIAKAQQIVLCRLDGTTVQSKVTGLYSYRGLDRVEIAEARRGRDHRDRGPRRGLDRRDHRLGREPDRAAADHGRRAHHLDAVLRQRLALLGSRRALRHVAQAARAPRARGADERRDQGRSDRRPGGVRSRRPRRAPALDPGRDHAPRGLRARRRQARGHDQDPRRRRPRADGDPAGRRAGGLRGRGDAPARPTPRPHDRDAPPGLEPRAPRVPHPVARHDRHALGAARGDPRHRHHPPRLRRLGPLAGRHPAPHHRRAGLRPRRDA